MNLQSLREWTDTAYVLRGTCGPLLRNSVAVKPPAWAALSEVCMGKDTVGRSDCLKGRINVETLVMHHTTSHNH
jgi:hypothetical protein